MVLSIIVTTRYSTAQLLLLFAIAFRRVMTIGIYYYYYYHHHHHHRRRRLQPLLHG